MHTPGFTADNRISLSSQHAEDLIRASGDRPLFLRSLTHLQSDVAAILSAHGGMLSFDALKEVTPDAARHLSLYAGALLDLSAIDDIPGDAAQELSQCLAPLRLDGLVALSEDAAASFGEYLGPELYLNGVKSLSPGAAQELSRSPASLYLNGIQSLSLAAAQHLASHSGDTLSLLGLVAVSEDVAAALSSFRGGHLESHIAALNSGETAGQVDLIQNEGASDHSEYREYFDWSNLPVAITKFLLRSIVTWFLLLASVVLVWQAIVDPGTGLDFFHLPRNSSATVAFVVRLIAILTGVCGSLLFGWVVRERFREDFYVRRHERTPHVARGGHRHTASTAGKAGQDGRYAQAIKTTSRMHAMHSALKVGAFLTLGGGLWFSDFVDEYMKYLCSAVDGTTSSAAWRWTAGWFTPDVPRVSPVYEMLSALQAVGVLVGVFLATRYMCWTIFKSDLEQTGDAIKFDWGHHLYGGLMLLWYLEYAFIGTVVYVVFGRMCPFAMPHPFAPSTTALAAGALAMALMWRFAFKWMR